MDMPMYFGWLSLPVVLHSSREFECGEKTPAQCEWYQHRWHFWYEADHVFALGTIYFCIAMVALFMLGRVFNRLTPSFISQTSPWKSAVAANRYLSYKTFHFRPLNWYSGSLGVLLLGAASFVFFFGMMLGPKPYYWPTFAFGAPASFGDSPPLATRSGWMALALLPFTIALPMKLNLITQVTGISHERLQVFHRWSAVFMLILGLVHTFPFIIKNIKDGTMMETWRTNPEYPSGVGMLVPQLYLTLFSWGPIRNRFYEFFKFTHIFVAVVFVVVFFVHCNATLTSWDYFIATGVVYFTPYTFSLLRTYLEHGFFLKANLELVTPNLLRISIPTPHAKNGGTHWSVGQHMFLRFLTPRLGVHCVTAHPFTICTHSSGIDAHELVFYVRPHRGITKRLAALAGSGSSSVSVYMDGPYGGMQETRLASFDDSLVIAGGSGAGFTLPIVEDWLRLRGFVKSTTTKTTPADSDKNVAVQVEPVSSGSSAASTDEKLSDLGKDSSNLLDRPATLHIILASRDPALVTWYTSQLSRLLRAYASTSSYASLPVIDVHITHGPTPHIADEEDTVDTDELSRETSRTLRKRTTYHSGRPVLPSIISEFSENAAAGKRVGVAVCGPESMIYDVRNACAEAQGAVLRKGGRGEVYLHSECFGW